MQKRLAQLAPSKRVLVVLYPDQTELKAPTPHYLAFRQGLRNASELLEVREDAQWQPHLYRDSIHPTADGNRVLASMIEKRLALP